MRVFISAGEPSGDIHGANLARHLKNILPNVECEGFGGENMESAGCRLLFPLTKHAVMGFTLVLAQIGVFLRLLSQADRYFRHHRPDAVVLIDFPGFNWWIARRAKFHGIPVFYFVPPQLWAWAPWRVEKVRRFVDHVLCTLPLEIEWYRQRGVEAQYVGHPFFDELPQQVLDTDFIRAQKAIGGEVIGLLPGSRTQEVDRNIGTMIRAARAIHDARPDTRFLVACYKPHQQKMVDDYLASRLAAPRGTPSEARDRPLSISTYVGKTPEIIHVAKACIAVSGSVSLELLYNIKPTVVVYRARPLDLALARPLMTTKYISLVNLLAEKELFPEYLTGYCRAQEMADNILTWLDDAHAFESTVAQLRELRGTVATPGACARAAQFICDNLSQRLRSAA